jgi:hypothetical protein
MEFEAGSTSGSPRRTRNKIVIARSIRCKETPLINYPFAYLAEAGSQTSIQNQSDPLPMRIDLSTELGRLLAMIDAPSE